MGDFIGSFLENVWVRKRHVEKSRVGVEADFWGLTEGYLWKILTNKNLSEVLLCEVS